jgi:hypothetical protein
MYQSLPCVQFRDWKCVCVWMNLKAKYLHWSYCSAYFNKMKLWYSYVMGAVLHCRRNTDRCATNWRTPVKYSCKIPVWLFARSTKSHGRRLIFVIIYYIWCSLFRFLSRRHETMNMKSCHVVRLLASNRIPLLKYKLKIIVPYVNANWMIWSLAWCGS